MKMKWKITLPMLIILLISVLITTLTGYLTTRNTVDQMVDNVLDGALDMIIGEVARAKRTDVVVMEEISAKNIALAHSVSEKLLIMAREDSLDLADHMIFQNIANMLGIHELNVVDVNREIVGSNFDDYYGYIYPDDTIYKRILNDPNYIVIEEPREDAISGNIMLYYGVTRTDAPGFIQLGFEADAVKEFRANLDISHVAASLRIGLTGRASILRDGVIVYSQKTEIIGNDVSAEDWYAQISSGRGKVWIDLDGERMYAGHAEVDDYIFLVLFPYEEYNSYLSSVIWIGIIGLAVLLSAVFSLLYIAGKISKPIVALSAFMSRSATTGDIIASEQEEENMRQFTKSRDETGQLLKSCGVFIDHVVDVAKDLEIIANGDLSIEVELLSDKDTIGKSLKHMVENLNYMFNEISDSTALVSAGSKQIANGSQSLAQGSTEQAASVEELSSSIAEISQKTKDNAALADRAANLANTIKDKAEAGSRQMDEMTSAVKEINTASQSIGKVIKTIDDIAFQTNILALNAAVEAARAGQHGKGFAVVAEEVRNLAAKSADAAKDTGSLIANSMEKANLGARIADETAGSLMEIVSGINESSQIVSEIAISSEQQSVGIEQINNGIDQVAQVVQQNSATAEESAAASQEMSGQSATLENLIARFKLKSNQRPALKSTNPRKHSTELPHNSDDYGKY